jgi:hypothetical protein
MAVMAVLVGAVVVGIAKSNAPDLDITSVRRLAGGVGRPGRDWPPAWRRCCRWRS